MQVHFPVVKFLGQRVTALAVTVLTRQCLMTMMHSFCNRMGLRGINIGSFLSDSKGMGEMAIVLKGILTGCVWILCE